MTAFTLKQIESVAKSVWVDRNELERVFAGTNSGASSNSIVNSSRDLIEAFDQKGMRLYAKLMRTGWYEVMQSIYPLSQKVFGDNWHQVVDGYVKTFPPAHFNLNQLAQRFSAYLAGQKSQPSFLPQLADYEWLELEVTEHPAIVVELPKTAPSTVDDFLTLAPAINPTLRIRHYDFSIQEIATALENEDQLDSEELAERSTCIAAFRPPSAQHCEIHDLSESAIAIVETAMAEPTTYGVLATQAVNEHWASASPEAGTLQFIEMVEHLHDIGIFIGSIRINNEMI